MSYAVESTIYLLAGLVVAYLLVRFGRRRVQRAQRSRR